MSTKHFFRQSQDNATPWTSAEVFVKATESQNIGLANHRLSNTQKIGLQNWPARVGIGLSVGPMVKALCASVIQISGTEKQPKHKVLGQDIPRTSGRISGRTSWPKTFTCRSLSGPLNRLNATLSLLQPLDRYRTPSATGSAIGRPLSRPISHPNTGESPQPPRSKPLGGLNRAIVALIYVKPLQNQRETKMR